MKIKKRRGNRDGVAMVEFAICAPILLLIGFGFINAAMMVQMRHNAKIIGHLAATDLFVAFDRGPSTVAAIKEKYKSLAEDLGIEGLQIEISEEDDIALVRTSLSIRANSAIPIRYQSLDQMTTDTYVYAPIQ